MGWTVFYLEQKTMPRENVSGRTLNTFSRCSADFGEKSKKVVDKKGRRRVTGKERNYSNEETIGM